MSGKIAHIIVDDKFIDMALRQCDEVMPGQNIPVMVGASRLLRYVKRQDVQFYSFRQINDFFASDSCAAVIFHSLNDGFLPLLKHIPAGKTVIWLGWGFDYYDRLLASFYPDGFMLPQTKEMMRVFTPLQVIKSLGYSCKKVVKRVLRGDDRNIAALLSRVDYFSPVLEAEYLMATQANSWFRPKYISWNYGTVEDDYSGDAISYQISRNNILVGNSSAPENNHLEMFQLLHDNVDLSGRKIIVPLSYGNEVCREKIVFAGKKMFGDTFVPLIDYIPKNAYIELVASCGYVVMNHLRQQGMGNLLIMLMQGAKVFLNPCSPAFTWFVDKGVQVYSTEEFSYSINSTSNTLLPIPADTHKANVAILINYWGIKAQREKTRNLIDTALS